MNNVALIFIRHGNTFEANETPRYVGAGTDLPLTATGETQAQMAAQHLSEEYGSIAEIIAGPLQRTRRTADIIAKKLQLDFHTDDRLREIHFGNWEGLTTDEVREKFGDAVLEKWEQQSEWPSHMDWAPSYTELEHSMTNFLSEQHQKIKAEAASCLAVTSNGVLRTVYRLVTGQVAGAAAKVKTGHICVLKPEGEGWQVMVWNQKPDYKTP